MIELEKSHKTVTRRWHKVAGINFFGKTVENVWPGFLTKW